ncbi:MAG: FAD-dependent oxidoreductase [Pyrinomonadaceae bacterium]
MRKIKCDNLIIGGGPAGLAAAATSHRKTLLIDDNAKLGGQIWRAHLNKIKSKPANNLFKQIDLGVVQTKHSATFAALLTQNIALIVTRDSSYSVEFETAIIATGARERFLPFPGWTLPNVFGAGGLQALVKGGLDVKGKRVIVAGTGPLLLAVGEFLTKSGADVLCIAEQASNGSLFTLGINTLTIPSKLFKGFALFLNSKTKFLTNSYVVRAEGANRLESVTIYENGNIKTFECDLLAYGFHLVPNTEVAELFGCQIEDGFVSVNDVQETSVNGIFCAGEPTGIGGLELSLIEGKIAGIAADKPNSVSKSLLRQREKFKRFARHLKNGYELRAELRNLAERETIVCRCEDVCFGELSKFSSFRAAKLQTRLGMGACQGKICGSACEILFGWQKNTARPPLLPIPACALIEEPK